MINFTTKEKKVPFIKGVIYGDAGSGKTTMAANFIKESCKTRKLNKCIVIDTEQGWNWILTRELNGIEVLQPEISLTYKNYEDLFFSLDEYVQKNNVACVVIDSISKIGELIGERTLNYINDIAKKKAAQTGKTFYQKDDMSYVDWAIFREYETSIINVIRSLQCDVILCGRATSENAQDNNKQIKNATERTVQGFKKITYEFDFSILANVEFDITKDNIKTFTFLNIKNRIANDGEKFNDLTNVIPTWFSLTNDVEMDISEIVKNIENKIDIKDLTEYFNYLTEVFGGARIKSTSSIIEAFKNKKEQLTNNI